MNYQARTDHGGSVANFIIVGALLALLTIGGIYFLQNRNQSSGQPTPSPVASQPASPSDSKRPVPSASPSSAPTTKPSPSTKPSQSPAPTQSPQAGPLPATGPADDMVIASLPAAMLVAVTIAYMKSRRFASDATS